MLTLGGHRRFLSGLALGSSLFLGGVPRAAADDVIELVKPAEIKRAPTLPSYVLPSADLPFSVRNKPAAPSKEAGSDSHRRKTEPQATTKSSRRSHGASTVTELPIERLRQAARGYDFNNPALPTERSTLAELMKRLTGWTDSCPVCGKSCPLCGSLQADQAKDLSDVVSSGSATDGQMLGSIGRAEPGDEALSRPLRAGEPAQVILDTQKRLGKSVLDGTEFGGSPELLIQWIRALDEENRRQQAMLEEVSRADEGDAEEDVASVTGESQVEALRDACRQLQEAAELLEEQNLFESADSVRTVADALRRQSRHKIGDLEARRTTRASAEPVEDCKAEDCEGDHE